MAEPAPIPPEIQAYYARGGELRRLFQSHGQIELARTQEIVLRHLPPPPGTILDVGGGPGIYACWLAARGYRVHLIDAMPSHVEQARRVLRPGGLLFAVGIGRFASLLSGMVDNFLGDPDAREIVDQDLRDGQHRNPTAKDYFTTAFFHLPRELEDEVREAGFDLVELLGVEGPAWLLPDLERRWADGEERERLLEAARAVEREPTLLGIHPHLLAVARRGAP